MVREDLVSSAVTFLQDPSVAASPIEKRIAFLQSKNLTQEEIDLSLARVGEAPSPSTTATPSSPNQSNYGYPNHQVLRQAPAPAYGYGPYQAGPWGQQLPPEPPRRDWRDWFIMATVTSGVSYGLYVVAKRYILPIISPPTPPQLTTDLATIETSFNRAFTLIDQLSTDTTTLKTTEESRTEKLDSTLQDVETVITDLKSANKRREEEIRRISDQVAQIKEMVPKALETWKEEGDSRLRDLGVEMKSLKKLLANRVGTSTTTTTQPPPSRTQSSFPLDKDRPRPNGASTPRGDPPAPSVESQDSSQQHFQSISSVTSNTSENDHVLDAKPARRAAIPAWQMAASKARNEGAATGSGAVEGADVTGSVGVGMESGGG